VPGWLKQKIITACPAFQNKYGRAVRKTGSPATT
jgi:hypothetical protein